MKYQQLTKEQLEEFHEEFTLFLASQQIDRKEWERIKTEKPEVAKQEIDVFSDLVWDRVLSNVKYLEHFSERTLNLFRCEASQILGLVVDVDKEFFNFFDEEDYKWFIDNSNTSTIQYFKGQKPYQKERNIELFDLIKKGGLITKGCFI
ncbi:MAG: DUF6495 family protein [Flavobacteriaceae bacterium]|nr:DUF6495 family protein [Flavobacteriaceae bacterium]